MKMIFRITLGILCLLSCQSNGRSKTPALTATYAAAPPEIDGWANDACWARGEAYPIDQLWKGKLPHASDYMGRFKISWDSSHLYILAQVFDDSLRTELGDPCRDGLEMVLAGLNQIPGPTVTLHFGANGTRTTLPNSELLQIPDSCLQVRTNTQNRLTTWELMWSKDNWMTPKSPKPQPNPQEWARKILLAIAYSDCDKGNNPESLMGNVAVTPGPKAAMGVIEKDALSPLKLQPPAQ